MENLKRVSEKPKLEVSKFVTASEKVGEWQLDRYDFTKDKTSKVRFAIKLSSFRNGETFEFSEWSYQSSDFANELFFHATLDAMKNDAKKK
jgi:hypothetical protein